MSIAVLISICFAVAGIVLHDKQKSLVSLCDHVTLSVVISMPADLHAAAWLSQVFLLKLCCSSTSALYHDRRLQIVSM